MVKRNNNKTCSISLSTGPALLRSDAILPFLDINKKFQPSSSEPKPSIKPKKLDEIQLYSKKGSLKCEKKKKIQKTIYLHSRNQLFISMIVDLEATPKHLLPSD